MPRLNLAALTAEELQHLLGEAATQRLLPDISSARLAGRPCPGPPVSATLTFERLEERDWGATPEQARTLKAYDAQLQGLGAVPVGLYYVAEQNAARHQRAYLLEGDMALALRWSETPDGLASPLPFVQAVSLSRDRISGIAASLSSSAEQPFAPTPSEEVDVRLLPGRNPDELLSAHRLLAARHGRGQKLVNEADWTRAFVGIHGLNLQAWTRRGLLLPH